MFVIKSIFLTISGWFVIPILAWATPATDTHFRWLDNIFGNEVDGINGDPQYQEMHPNLFTRRWLWNAWRNPLNKWYYSQGPNGVIVSLADEMDSRGVITVLMDDTNTYSMVRTHLFGRYYWQSGYNLREDDRTGSKLEEGHYFKNRRLSWWGLKAEKTNAYT